jgi:hypothetical protein
MFYRNTYLFYGKEGGITIFCACIKAGAGLMDIGKVTMTEDDGIGITLF